MVVIDFQIYSFLRKSFIRSIFSRALKNCIMMIELKLRCFILFICKKNTKPEIKFCISLNWFFVVNWKHAIWKNSFLHKSQSKVIMILYDTYRRLNHQNAIMTINWWYKNIHSLDADDGIAAIMHFYYFWSVSFKL